MLENVVKCCKRASIVRGAYAESGYAVIWETEFAVGRVPGNDLAKNDYNEACCLI
jgi:hypothetical protein